MQPRAKAAVSEPQWKRQLIEHDIKIQNVKNVVNQANYLPNTFITNMLDELTQSN